MPGIAGQFFKEFGLTVSVAVLFSLVVARLVTPLLAAYFLKPAKHTHARRELLEGFYQQRAGLGAGPPDGWPRPSAACCSSPRSPWSASCPKGFTAARRRRLRLSARRGPPGATRADMDAGGPAGRPAVPQAQPDVEQRLRPGRRIGGGFGGGGGADLRDGTVSHGAQGQDRKPTTEEFKGEIRAGAAQDPDVRVNTLGDGGGASTSDFVLAGENGPLLEDGRAKLVDADERPEGPSPTAPVPRPPPSVRTDRDRRKPDEAARLGVNSVDTSARSLRVATIGDIDANVRQV